MRERAAGLSMPAYLGSKVIVFGATTVLQSAVLVAVVLGHQRLPSRDPIGMLPVLASRTTVLRGLRPFAAGAVLSWQPIEIGLAVAMAGLAGMALGLAISARVRRSDQAILLLPVVLVVQMALSLPLLQAQNHSTVLRTLADFTSANWAMNVVAATTSLNQLLASFYVSNDVGSYWISKELGRSHSVSLLHGEIARAIVGNGMWQHAPGSWWQSMGILVCFVVGLLGLAWLSLHRTSGHRDPFGTASAE